MGSGGAGGAGSATPVLGGPFYTRLQRLTKAQWERSVADILRLDPSATTLPGLFPPARADAAFDNNERLLFVDLAAQLAFEMGAEAAAALATGSPEALAKVHAGTDPAAFVREVGRRVFRRPPTAEEEARYQKVFAYAETLYGAGFNHGAALVIRAMLQSPAFLYRTELGLPGEALGAFELASKLSFLLTGSTPSDDLLDLAAAGGLDTADGVEQAARAMLGTAGAVAVMRDFHGQLYQLERYGSRAPAPLPPPTWVELAEVSDRFFDWVFESGEGLRAILTSRRAFIGPQLAYLYGIESGPGQIEQRTMDASRAGFFMQVPFLWSTGGGVSADAFGRGAAIDQQVLCATLQSHATPPVPEYLPAPAAGVTPRMQLEQLTAPCGGCHTTEINPLGFAFDAFDSVGRRREGEGAAVDTRGSYVLDSATRTFGGAKELMSLLADSDQAHACYAGKLMGYALQRDLVAADRPLLTELAAISRSKSLKEMVVALVRSPAFRVRAEVMP